MSITAYSTNNLNRPEGEPDPSGPCDCHGIPAGGGPDQVLKKNSAIDYDASWGDEAAAPINQNNIIRIKSILVTETTNAAFVAAINALPTFDIAETEIYNFIASAPDAQNPLYSALYTIILNGLGKGTYGIAGTQITTNHIWVTGVRRFAPDFVENLQSTQTIDLGNIGTSDIVTAFNAYTFLGSQDPVQDQSKGYVLVTAIESGVTAKYLFTGAGGSYGTGGTLTAVLDNFAPFQETVASDYLPTGGYSRTAQDIVDMIPTDFTEENLTGATQTILNGTGNVTATYNTHSQLNLTLIADAILSITLPILEIGQSCSRLMHVVPNGFNITFDTSLTYKMSGFDNLDFDKEFWIVTRFTRESSSVVSQFSNLTVFPFVPESIAWGDLVGSITNQTDLNFILNNKEDKSNKDKSNGYAGLDVTGKLNPSTLPALAITDTFAVGSQSAMLALVCETGDVAVRTDLSKSFILQGTNPTLLEDWQELLAPAGGVSTVFGRSGAVTAQTNDYTADQIQETANRVFLTPEQKSSIANKADKSTTLVGYGITDAYTKTVADGRYALIGGNNTFNGGNTFKNTIRVENGGLFPVIDFHNTIDSRLLYRNGNTLLWRYDGTNNGELWHSGNSFQMDSEGMVMRRINKSSYLQTYETDVVAKLRESVISLGRRAAGYKWNMKSKAVQAWGNLPDFVISKTDGANVETDQLVINSAGNVGIGTSSPSEKLEVAGNIKATAFFESSDERIKDNIIHISDTFRSFKLKNTEVKRYGVIAQEVEKTNPELVKKDDKGMMSVNYTDLLCMKVAEQENKIKRLENLVKQLINKG